MEYRGLNLQQAMEEVVLKKLMEMDGEGGYARKRPARGTKALQRNAQEQLLASLAGVG